MSTSLFTPFDAFFFIDTFPFLLISTVYDASAVSICICRIFPIYARMSSSVSPESAFLWNTWLFRNCSNWNKSFSFCSKGRIFTFTALPFSRGLLSTADRNPIFRLPRNIFLNSSICLL